MARCSSITRNRSRCRRSAISRNKCWQHANKSRSPIVRSPIRQRPCKDGYRKIYDGRCVRDRVTRSGERCSPGYRRSPKPQDNGKCIFIRPPVPAEDRRFFAGKPNNEGAWHYYKEWKTKQLFREALPFHYMNEINYPPPRRGMAALGL